MSVNAKKLKENENYYDGFALKKIDVVPLTFNAQPLRFPGFTVVLFFLTPGLALPHSLHRRLRGRAALPLPCVLASGLRRLDQPHMRLPAALEVVSVVDAEWAVAKAHACCSAAAQAQTLS